jgi:hypothetical protein
MTRNNTKVIINYTGQGAPSMNYGNPQLSNQVYNSFPTNFNPSPYNQLNPYQPGMNISTTMNPISYGQGVPNHLGMNPQVSMSPIPSQMSSNITHPGMMPNYTMPIINSNQSMMPIRPTINPYQMNYPTQGTFIQKY